MASREKTVGYIGLGIMGAAMARNQLKAGFALTVWNRTAAKCVPLAAAGATIAASPAAVAAANPQVICINVTDTTDVEDILFGDNGVASTATAGLVVIDHSTISPVATTEFARRLEVLGVTLLDAPVTGGDIGAREATLSIMVGGKAEAFERCLPLLRSVGTTITHLGPSGAGQTCKACNQVAVALTLLGTCEALALAKQSGLDPAQMLEVLAGGAASSWQLQQLGPRIVSGDHEPGFMVDLMLKDLGIVADAARSRSLTLEGTALVESYFRVVSAAGHGSSGTQALATALEQRGRFRFGS